MTSIPKIIHQIWYQGCTRCISDAYAGTEGDQGCTASTIPEKYHRFQDSWKQNHPHRNYICWDQTKIEELIKTKEPFRWDVYSSLPYMIQRIDYAKYVILKHYGGVYADMDIESLKPLDDLLNQHADKRIFLSEINLCESGKWCLPMWAISKGKYSYGPYYNNGIMMSAKGETFWDDVLDDVEKNVKRKWHQTHDHYIHDSAGPMVFNRVVREKGYDKDPSFRLCPYYFLEPCDKFNLPGSDSIKTPCDTSRAYTIHYYGNSWMSPSLKKLMYVYYNPSNTIVILSILLLIAACLLRLIANK